MKTIAEASGENVDFWERGRPVRKKYDLGIFCHIKHTKALIPHCKKTILVTHGVVNEERPSNDCDITLATSEEVRDHWGLDCPIIRQPIDTAYWSVSKRSFLSLCRFAYRRGETHSQSVSRLLSLNYERIAGLKSDQILEILARSAVCHATGRAALEAMSCGVPTVIYDHREAYQPHLLDDGPLLSSATTNYSGRGGTKNPSVGHVFKATQKALDTKFDYRQYILENHDAKKIAKEILCYSY